MIRKSTWVVLAIFLVLSIIAIFLRWSPTSPMNATTATPVYTAVPYALTGISTPDINGVILESAEGTTSLVRNADLTWTRNEDEIVEAGKVEELLANIVTMRALTVLADDYNLETLSLTPPAQTITLVSGDRTVKIGIGGLTPTGTGNYIRIDEGPAIVVSQYAIEAILTAFDNAIPSTPTPPAPEATPTT